MADVIGNERDTTRENENENENDTENCRTAAEIGEIKNAKKGNVLTETGRMTKMEEEVVVAVVMADLIEWIDWIDLIEIEAEEVKEIDMEALLVAVAVLVDEKRIEWNSARRIRDNLKTARIEEKIPWTIAMTGDTKTRTPNAMPITKSAMTNDAKRGRKKKERKKEEKVLALPSLSLFCFLCPRPPHSPPSRVALSLSFFFFFSSSPFLFSFFLLSFLFCIRPQTNTRTHIYSITYLLTTSNIAVISPKTPIGTFVFFFFSSQTTQQPQTKQLFPFEAQLFSNIRHPF
jgi:hypothetical protein